MDEPRPPPRPSAPPPSTRRDAPPDGLARRKRFTREAIAAALRELEGGVPAPLVCRRHGVSDRTLYRWRREEAARRAPRGEGGE